MTHHIVALDHVQLAMPVGGEGQAVAFYEDLLGLRRVPKPERLAVRGGCWFEGQGFGIHLGAEEAFVPAKKAHPALVIEGYRDLLDTLESAGVEIRPNHEIEGVERCHIDDPFGNRIELIAKD